MIDIHATVLDGQLEIIHALHSLCSMSRFCDTSGGLAELEWDTQDGGGLNTNQWLPCKEARHNVLLQKTELELRTLQQARGDVLLWLLSSIIHERLIATADQLQEVTDAMEAEARTLIL